MNDRECSFERRVVRAAQSDEWPDDLRAHIAGCTECQQTKTAAILVKRLSGEGASAAAGAEADDQMEFSLPRYRVIWLKAQYVRRQERLSSLDILSLAGLWAVGAAGFLGLILWKFPRLLKGVLENAGTASNSLTGVFSHYESLAVAGGVFLLVWLLTKERFFAES